MKNYTLDELLNTKKAQKIMDENSSSYNDENVVYAVLEINYWRYENWKTIYDFDDLENAINDIEKWRIQYYNNIDEYHDSCDDTIDFWWNDFLERYFDYDSFHNDCDYDITETSNWIVLGNR